MTCPGYKLGWGTTWDECRLDLAAKRVGRSASQERAVRPRRSRPRRGDLDGRDADATILASPRDRPRSGVRSFASELDVADDPHSPMTVLAQVVDPDGQRVELTVERWDHIVDDHAGHPELGAFRADVMLAVSDPHEQRPRPAR